MTKIFPGKVTLNAVGAWDGERWSALDSGFDDSVWSLGFDEQGTLYVYTGNFIMRAATGLGTLTFANVTSLLGGHDFDNDAHREKIAPAATTCTAGTARPSAQGQVMMSTATAICKAEATDAPATSQPKKAPTEATATSGA